MSLYPRYAPLSNPVDIGGHLISSHHALQAYLPGIWRFPIRRYGILPVEGAIQRSILVRSGKVPPQHLREVWQGLLWAIAQNAEPAKVNITLGSQLELSFDEERQRPSRGHRSHFPQTLRFFECLADIAALCYSRHLQTVLSTFFIKHGKKIASVEPPEAIVHWGMAIVASGMPKHDLFSCLPEIYKGSPDWFFRGERAMSRHFSPEAMSFRLAMDGAAMLMQKNEDYLANRGRSRRVHFNEGYRYGRGRLRPRRPTPGLDDDVYRLLGGLPSRREPRVLVGVFEEMDDPLMGLPGDRFNRRRPGFHDEFYDSDESDVFLDIDDESDFDAFSGYSY